MVRLALMAQTAVESQILESASAFSPVTLRALSRARLSEDALRRISPVAALLRERPEATLGEAFDAAHRALTAVYRTEYVYKNELISRIVFGRHSPRTASAVLELRMGDSCADVVILNGTSTVYEIKTDLDQFSRLEGQLWDYSSRAEHVNVVVSEGRASVACDRSPKHVGILALRKNGSISTIREAESNIERMHSDHLFGMLRVGEAHATLKQLCEWDAPPDQVQAWYEARELFSSLDTSVAHAELVHHLRQRGSASNSLVVNGRFPVSLRALAYAEEFSQVGMVRIQERLCMEASLFVGVDKH